MGTRLNYLSWSSAYSLLTSFFLVAYTMRIFIAIKVRADNIWKDSDLDLHAF